MTKAQQMKLRMQKDRQSGMTYPTEPTSAPLQAADDKENQNTSTAEPQPVAQIQMEAK
jgi:hypothetical protein